MKGLLFIFTEISPLTLPSPPRFGGEGWGEGEALSIPSRKN
jgi:hypothetical protein